MKLIVGLGNPGREYDKSRHNVGFMVVDRLVRRHAPGQTPRARFQAATCEARIADENCLFIKPNTYMNRSGRSVGEAVRFHKSDPATDLLVIVDDVALPTGAVRVRARGGTGGHNGLADIERALGGDSYPRVRIGIGASPEFMDQADYVLGRFTEFEWSAVEPAVDCAADAVETFVREGVDAAMNRFNIRADPGDGDQPHPDWFTPHDHT